mgnify:FL=1
MEILYQMRIMIFLLHQKILHIMMNYYMKYHHQEIILYIHAGVFLIVIFKIVK